jgi:hypothetical protein
MGVLEADVDEGLVPLITEMWRANVETIMSCQEQKEEWSPGVNLPESWVWIYLYAPAAEEFCSIVAGEFDDDPESLYQRISGEKASDRSWWYDGHATNIADEGGPAEITFDISVRFPRDDLPEVLRRMQAHNAEED